MIAVLCALLSGGLYFLCTGLGHIWPLAWIAPAPLLWLAFGDGPGWRTALASFAGFALGQLNLFEAYAVMAPMIAVMIAINSSLFAAAVLFAGWVRRRTPSLAAVLAFPSLWTAIEYLNALVSPNGSFGALAYSQTPAPILIQSTSVFGLWSVSFLLCLAASALAMVLRDGRRAAGTGLLAALAFAANIGFGWARLEAPAGRIERVGAVADDSQRFGGGAAAAGKVTARYAELARALASQHADTVVLPEKIAILNPAWTDETASMTRAAQETGSRIVVSFEEHADQSHNTALTFAPDGRVFHYFKRHLVPGLERLVPGAEPGLLGGGRAVAICKDMDFPGTIMSDARHGVRMMFVPAWDFHADREIHADMAIMRGVENGFALVRAARDGLLTASDAEGRVIARAATGAEGPVSIVADLPEGRGATPYLRLGDLFAWLCLGVALTLAVIASVRSPSAKRA